MEFAIKTLVLLVISVIALLIFILIFTTSAEAGNTQIEGLLNYLKGLLGSRTVPDIGLNP